MNIVAKIKKRNKTIGYIEKSDDGRYGSSYYFWEVNPKKEIPQEETLEVVEMYSGYAIKPKKDLLKTLATMPIGTPLKIKGCVEGMEGQQLVYCGSTYDRDIKWLKTYWFFDGKAATGDFPERFGFFEKQLFYDGVEITFDDNNKEIVDNLRSDYSYLCSVAESFK